MKAPYFQAGEPGNTTVIVTTWGPAQHAERLRELPDAAEAGILVIRLRDLYDITRSAMLGQPQPRNARLRNAVTEVPLGETWTFILAQSYALAATRVLVAFAFAYRRWGRRLAIEWPAQEAINGAENTLAKLKIHEYMVITMWGILPWPIVFHTYSTPGS